MLDRFTDRFAYLVLVFAALAFAHVLRNRKIILTF